MRRLRFIAVVGAAAIALAWPRAARADALPTPTDAATPFFDDSGLQEIRLVINTRDWQSLIVNYMENTYYPCDLIWRDQRVRNIGIRSRGTGSRSGVKPGLRVDFNRYTTDQSFLGLKSVVLRNNTQDASEMHERLSMLFFRRMGIEAPREAHARMYVNNEYMGIYSIVENVDSAAYQKRVYDESNGYVFKYDYNVGDQPYYFEYRGSDPASYVPSPFKPESHTADPQSEKLVDTIRIINEDSDAIFERTIAPYLDLPRVIKHLATEIFLADNDGFNGNWGANNFYLYRNHDTTLFNLMPWDKSNAFVDGPTYPVFHNIADAPPEQRNRLTMRILGLSDLRQQFFDALLACADAALAVDEANADDSRGWMEREVEREYQQIQDGIYSDGRKPFTNEDFEREVENLRAFARDRSAFVRAEVAAAHDAGASR